MEEQMAVELSDEQLAKLPWGPNKEPATSWDVAEEIAQLCALIAASAQGGANHMVAAMQLPTFHARKLRLALALESWVGEAGKDVILSLFGVESGGPRDWEKDWDRRCPE
jgi:hypothetical protein